jgi:hypothetical protein
MFQTLSRHWMRYQPSLFKDVQDADGPPTDKHKEIILALDVIGLDHFIFDGPSYSVGRPRHSRLAIARALVAKSALNLPTTKGLIERLKVDAVLRRICGFATVREVPAESTFSEAFAEFARNEIWSKIHEHLVKFAHKDTIVGHISRDATEIHGREKIAKTSPKAPRKKKLPTGYKVGRPKKGEIREVQPKNNIQVQLTQKLPEILDNLPKAFNCGSKKGSRGNLSQWFGYKLHVDVCDDGIPISCILTSASVNDSQCSVPLEMMTNSRVKSLYTLADKGYDSIDLRRHVESFGKVPIFQPRDIMSEDKVEFDPAMQERFKRRTTVERTFSMGKDSLGFRNVRVKGHAKVFAHLMTGILMISALRILETS